MFKQANSVSRSALSVAAAFFRISTDCSDRRTTAAAAAAAAELVQATAAGGAGEGEGGRRESLEERQGK